jgi:DNA-binding CsgD family transcriptional regulator
MATARGDAALAESVLGDSVAQLHVDDPVYGTEIVALAEATRRECGGDQAGALHVLARFWRIDADRGVRYYHRTLAPALVRLAYAAGRADLIAEVVRGMDEAAALAGGIATVTGAAARCRGLRDHDPDLLLHGVRLLRVGGRTLDYASACEDAAAALVKCGRSDEAVAVLEEALARYNAVGATAYAARVSAALRALGRRRGARGARQRPERGWQSLTTSERMVCDLVAGGLTNRQVAQRLHVSPHTVNTHLRHVFQKLDVATRTELAGHVLRARNNHASE